MNSGYDYDKETGAIKFPSPTGVNHYEYKVIELIKAKEKQFPSPTGVKYHEYAYVVSTKVNRFIIKFPSPTGVNHYELVSYATYNNKESGKCFRPLQGLTIMNC